MRVDTVGMNFTTRWHRHGDEAHAQPHLTPVGFRATLRVKALFGALVVNNRTRSDDRRARLKHRRLAREAVPEKVPLRQR
jgi:hypothetical protein